MQAINFISGLPRSGSTLLSAILSQNPRFKAHMSGPVAGLLNNLLESMSGKNEFSVFIDDEQRHRILKSVVESYYADQPDKVVFDTSRSWCARMALIEKLYPKAKVIACVRHVSWVVDSIEQLVQKNVFQPSSIFHYLAGGTVYSRADGVAGGDGMVGYAYNALKQAYYSKLAPGRLILVQYETLTTNPELVIAQLYDFLGEPLFKHDFNNLNFDASEFDQRSGTPGLHTIHKSIRRTERQSALPPDVFRRFENDQFWLNPALQRQDVRII
jgi:sulfotransferase